MNRSIETHKNLEKHENLESRILLKLFRHSIKGEKQPDDRDVILSQEGRELAASKYIDLENPTLAKIIGTDRIRTIETAGLIKDGDLDKTVEETLSETGILGAPMAEVDRLDRLNFTVDAESATGKAGYEAYGKGEWLKWVVNESDQNVLENGDMDKNVPYSKQAANIASIIKDYFEQASDRWHKIYEAEQDGDNQRKFPKGYGQTLERLMGSHQGVTESFLAKVIEKTKGIEERDKFVEALNNNGFSETEGYDIEIVNDGEDKTINVNYTKFDDQGYKIFEFNESVPQEVLDEILKEGERFNVRESSKS
ncbi:hypothetical protein KC866_00430 [Patescibacteria group bacterium]|nr:hypothetical protein [Patescibacteria group bacterium]